MKKKIIRIGLIIIVALSVCMSSQVMASDDTQDREGGDISVGGNGEKSPSYTLEDPIKNPDAYKPKDNLTSDNTKFIEMGGSIIAAIRAIGTLIMVVALMIMGIRYMIGSTADKANYKQSMIPYLIGAIMIFAIPQMIGIIYELITNNF